MVADTSPGRQSRRWGGPLGKVGRGITLPGIKGQSVVRHPSDIIRAILGAFVLCVCGLIAQQGLAVPLEKSIFRTINGLPDGLAKPFETLMQAGALPTVGMTVALALLVRRFSLALNLAGAGLVAHVAAMAVKWVVKRERPEQFLESLVAHATVSTGFGFPSGQVAVASALATTAGPYLNRPARRLAWAVVWCVAFARMYFGARLPLDVIGGAALGWAVGATFNLLLGAPGGRTSRHAVEGALEDAGFDPLLVRPASVDARASTPFLVETSTGQQLFVKSYTPERRDADWLFRAWRFLAYRGTRDEAPFLTLKQQIEHEAYASLLAEKLGVATPSVVYAGQGPSKVGLLAQERITATGLDSLPGESIDDDMLRGIWEQVGTLRGGHIAHRDLRRANVLVDDHRQPWIIDFGFAEAGASERKLAGDVAEMLGSLAYLVGPERAVRSGLETLGDRALVSALPLLQPLALSSATRDDLKGKPHLLEDVRSTIAEAVGREPGPLETLTRLQKRTLLWMAMGAAAVYFLLPQVSGLQAAIQSLEAVQPMWLAVGAVLSALTYAMAAVALQGAVERHTRFFPTLLVQVASSFVGRFTPQGIGGLALNERYLEKAGVARSSAVAAIALNTLAGVVMHLTITAVVGVMVGSSGLLHLQMPVRWQFLLIIAMVLALVGLIMRSMIGRFVTAVKSGFVSGAKDLLRVLRRPARALALFGGSAALTIFYGLTLMVSM
ncbi:MAG: phosphatase PAP2 family protein, partial [Chloroflexota bacterium]|nr:phosphatase PAP2 family protein [Chloroflexota bacterium]